MLSGIYYAQNYASIIGGSLMMWFQPYIVTQTPPSRTYRRAPIGTTATMGVQKNLK